MPYKNPEDGKANKKEYYVMHHERELAKRREYCAKNRDKERARAAEYRNNNRDKVRASDKRFREKHLDKVKVRDTFLKRKYGISLDEWNLLYEKQRGLCANSGCGKALETVGRWTAATDHDHISGIVRGLLCHGCNTALGLLHDDYVRINGLAEYVKQDARVL
jgi:hypothetical protein